MVLGVSVVLKLKASKKQTKMVKTTAIVAYDKAFAANEDDKFLWMLVRDIYEGCKRHKEDNFEASIFRGKDSYIPKSHPPKKGYVSTG